MFAVAALAIGVGASTAMFGVLDAVALQPLPFAHEARLVAGWKTNRTDPTRFIELSYPEFLQWQSQSTSFESLAALPTTVYGYSYVLTGRGDPVSIESALPRRMACPSPVPSRTPRRRPLRKPRPSTKSPAAVESAVERRTSAATEPTAERQPLVAIVSESVAREMYGSPLNAVGQRFAGGRNAPRSYRIVGVVADGRYRRVQEVSGDVFLPYTQTAIPLRYLVIRTSASAGAARGTVRRALAEVDPEQPMSADLTTTELVERALSRERFQSALLLPFGLGSVLLAALGVFGMVSDAANRRLRELALRRALGAHRSRILAELLRSTLACVLTGLCIGVLLAMAAGRTLNLALFETRLADPWILVAVCTLILGVSLTACGGPAVRVSRLDVRAVWQ